ncbi:phosphotransferase [Streptomyces sp. NPDC054863]
MKDRHSGRTEGPPYHPRSTLTLTPQDLRRPVGALLGDPGARVTDCTAEPISYQSWSRSSAGLHVVRGTARAHGADHPWELVLKQVRHRPWTPGPADRVRQIDDGGDAQDDWAYWRREALALGSGLLDRPAGGFAAPRLLDVVPQAEDRMWLWLERVRGLPGEEWSAQDLLDTARRLGAFHSRHAAHPPGPYPWYCRPFVEQAALGSMAELIDRAGDASGSADPLLRALFPRTAVTALRALWRHHDDAVRRLRGLPATLVHRDLTPRNLFRTEKGTVAVDWGQTGVGPAGEDLATLVLTSAPARGLGPEALWELGEAAVHAHRAGPEPGGRSAEAEDLLLAYRLVAAYHFGMPLVVTAHKLLSLPEGERRAAVAEGGLRAKAAVMTAHLERVQPDLPRLRAA